MPHLPNTTQKPEEFETIQESTVAAAQFEHPESFDDQELPEIIEKSNIDKKDQEKILQIMARREYHSGPLPSPDVLERYKQIDPRIVDYVLDTAKDEQKHRHEMDKTNINNETLVVRTQSDFINGELVMKKRQQLFGFLMVFALLCFAGYALKIGSTAMSLGPLITAIAGFAAIVFWGNKQKDNAPESDSEKNRASRTPDENT